MSKSYSEEETLIEDIIEFQKFHHELSEVFNCPLSQYMTDGLLTCYNNFAKSMNWARIDKGNFPNPNKLATHIFQTMGNHYEHLKKHVGEMEKKLDDLKKTPSHPVNTNNIIQVSSDTYIDSNILMSAAPRKDRDSEDTELGEDASGVMNTSFGTFFWVLDGTSDSPSITDTISDSITGIMQHGNSEVETHIEGKEVQKKQVFSSRVLAQSFSANIAQTISDDKLFNNSTALNFNTSLLYKIMEESLKKTTDEMTRRIKEVQNKDIITNIKKSISNNIIPYCSTTFLLGFLDKSGKLEYIILGDSDIYSYRINKGSEDGDKYDFLGKEQNDNPSRLFLFITLDKDNEIIIQTNEYDTGNKIRRFNKEDVDLLFAFSDGIGASEKPFEMHRNPKQVFWNIAKVQQGTYDDKTLIMLERKQLRQNAEIGHERKSETVNTSTNQSGLS